MYVQWWVWIVKETWTLVPCECSVLKKLANVDSLAVVVMGNGGHNVNSIKIALKFTIKNDQSRYSQVFTCNVDDGKIAVNLKKNK